jgi:predicted membrane protein
MSVSPTLIWETVMAVGVGRVVVPVVPAAGGVILLIFAFVASIVYVVEFLPVKVMLSPFTAVTVPETPGAFALPDDPAAHVPRPPLKFPSMIAVAATEVPLTVPRTIRVSPTAIWETVIVVGVGRVVEAVPDATAAILLIFAFVASTVYVVEFLPVKVMLSPLTAVTVPLTPEPFLLPRSPGVRVCAVDEADMT